MLYDLIAIGTITVDQFIIPPKALTKGNKNQKELSFFLGAKMNIEPPVISCGGGAYNVARTFEKGGHKTALLSSVGADFFGEYIKDILKKTKISSKLSIHKGENTGISYILLSSSGERTILTHREPLGNVSQSLKNIKAKWAYVVPGDLSYNELQHIIEILHTNNIKIACTPSAHMLRLGETKLKKLFDKMQVVIMNREEASLATGVPVADKKKVFKKLDAWVKGIVVMTDGAKGVYVSDGKNIFEAGIFKEKKIIDRTGAGDAFGSGFIAGLFEKKEGCLKGKCNSENIMYALRRGSANATSVIEHIGSATGVMTKKEFESDIRWKNLKIKRS